MLKNSLLIGTVTLALGLTSCKDESSTSLCDCMEVQAEILEKSLNLPANDEVGFQKIKDQFKKEVEDCEEFSESFNVKHKNLSREEKKEIQAKELEGCDAVLHLEELMQERMDKIKSDAIEK